MRRERIYIPEGVGELKDLLGFMLLYSPMFIDDTGYFPNQNIDTVFRQLKGGLLRVRQKLGEDLYLKLVGMADQMRAHFEADPENKTDDTLKGRDIILEMEGLLKQVGRRSGGPGRA